MSTTLQQQLEQCLVTLDVGPDSNWKDIETQYRQLIQRWHPDRHIDAKDKVAENKFIEINSAYKLIREHYRKNGAIPRQIPENQGALLGTRKEQPKAKPAFYKRKAFLFTAIGLALVIGSSAVLWSLDARMAANNRDRATVEKSSAARSAARVTHSQMVSGDDNTTQSSNDIEP